MNEGKEAKTIKERVKKTKKGQGKVKERVGVIPVFIEEAADLVRHKHIHFSIYVNSEIINIY